MEVLKTIPPEVASLIPKVQLQMTRGNLKEFSDAILHLKSQLEKCPKIRETDNGKEHPAIFHYFDCGGTDIYISEFDRKDYMFGYAILNGDLLFSEWGYFDLTDLVKIPQYNIDYHFEEQTVEAALYTAYPHHFKKPKSLEPAKNDQLPDIYRNFPYQYMKGSLGTVLRKNLDEVYLYGDDETKFFQDCNRAKQHSRSLADVIEEYFIN